MTTVYPGAIDALPRPGAATYMDDPGFEADVVVDDLADAVEAVETKVGTGASTPTAGTVLRGTGTGTSGYGAIVNADISASAAIVATKLAAVPAARAYHSTTQSIANSTATALALDSERFDTDTIHDTVTNNSRLTCKTAGKYLIIGNVRWAANTTGARVCSIRLNGGTDIGSNAAAPTPSSVMTHTVETLYQLAVNDYVELFVTQFSGGALNVDASTNYSPEFMMVRVSA